jgi:hypothetical protein
MLKSKFIVISLLALNSCASPKSDPLKNSKKLIKEGHATLYNNGAFQIPSTKIKLIPPGPDAISLAKELSGIKAKESFLKYLNEIGDGTIVIYEGTKSSYRFAKEVDKNIDRELRSLAPKLQKGSVVILKESFATSMSLIGSSWNFSKEIHQEARLLSKELKSTDSYKSKPFDGGERFVKGYAILPKKIEARLDSMDESLSFHHFAKDFKKSEAIRKEGSSVSTYLIGDAFKNYAKDINESLSHAGDNLEDDNSYGPTFSSIKAIAWLLEGIVWQGIAKPIGKATAGAIGYVMVNGAFYPVLLLTQSGVTTSKIAVEVLFDSMSGLYEIVAPTGELALSSLLYSGDYLFHKTADVGAKVSGVVVGKSLEYIGAPIVSSVVTVGGTASGVAVAAGGTVLSGATMLSSGIMTVSSKVVSKTAAATVFTGGVIAHTLKGTGEVAYEITKTVTVPSGYILGGGLALSYGTLTHLSAQTVLAAADAAYLVLSLEGPKWVIYAVQGKVGSDYSEGTVLNLEKMQTEGEVFHRLPVSEEEMNGVIKELTHE